MRPFKIFMIAACISIAALAMSAFIGIKNKKKTVSPVDGFAFVELFTSEGCSSCPPADELVARIQKESSTKPVYILAYHVDYWNRLGWKDAFSSPQYSQRQNQYANWLHLSSVYTPQIVVNGKNEFVGSSEDELRNAIKNSLQKSSGSRLMLSDLKGKNNQASVEYHINGITQNRSLLIALVEKSATTNVLHGENGGHTLSHVQIVRKLQSLPLNNKSSGTVTIELPHNFDSLNWEVIGFVQNLAGGEIMAANKINFQPGKNDTVVSSSK